MFSVKWGKMVVNRGEKIHAEDFGVIPPPLVVKRGDPFDPSSAAVPSGPRTYSKTNKRCACSAWAAGVFPALRNCIWGRSGHVGTPAVHEFCLYPQMAEKKGVYPHLTISLFRISPRRDSNSRTNTTSGIRWLPVDRRPGRSPVSIIGYNMLRNNGSRSPRHMPPTQVPIIIQVSTHTKSS